MLTRRWARSEIRKRGVASELKTGGVYLFDPSFSERPVPLVVVQNPGDSDPEGDPAKGEDQDGPLRVVVMKEATVAPAQLGHDTAPVWTPVSTYKPAHIHLARSIGAA